MCDLCEDFLARGRNVRINVALVMAFRVLAAGKIHPPLRRQILQNLLREGLSANGPEEMSMTVCSECARILREKTKQPK